MTNQLNQHPGLGHQTTVHYRPLNRMIEFAADLWWQLVENEILL